MEKQKKGALKFISSLIVDYRFIIFLLFAAAAVYCFLSLGKVRINSDLTAFLPDSMETRKGLTVMEEEFTSFASSDFMLSNVTFDTAQNIADQIKEIEHVDEVTFDDTSAHYTGASALITVSFDGGSESKGVVDAEKKIEELISPYDHYISTDVGVDYVASLANEMIFIMAIAVAVIAGVLIFTSRSYFEVVIFAIVFVFSGLLNMGTNYWLGEISSITNTIAVIMQLALAIDYAIIFAHRYQDEAAANPDSRAALIEALSKSIVEISSSSLTTIAGLAALTLMQFRLGYDMGIVLAKGIICSMITVFLLMPGLIMMFPRMLKKTEHKNFVPKISGWGKFLGRTKILFVVIFLLMIPAAIYCSGKTEYAFADGTIDELVYSESRAAMHKINDTFAPDTAVAIMVPAGDFEKEKAILKEVEALQDVKSATGLANIEIDDDLYLTDRVNPRKFAELLNIDIEQAQLLYQAYGVQHEEYQALMKPSSYEVPLVDMFLYMFEKSDQGIFELDEEQSSEMNDLRKTLERAVELLRGEKWDRMVLTSSLPAEGGESVALVEKIHEIADKYYDGEEVLVTGDITSARDLRESYSSDSVLISILTAAFVFIILLLTFRSLAGAVILVFVIQGSIWINFSFPFLTGTHVSFVTNMIVSAIQMGATIDYAIVLMSRYLALRDSFDKRDAMARAVSESFPTVITSGSILTMAGFLIAYRISDVYVGHIGLAVGRGALISVILVLTVLPQLLVLFDKAISKTTFRINLFPGKRGEDT